MARITLPGGKRKALGYFDDERSAALAYDRAVVEHDLKLKRLNFATAPQVVVSAASSSSAASASVSASTSASASASASATSGLPSLLFERTAADACFNSTATASALVPTRAMPLQPQQVQVQQAKTKSKTKNENRATSSRYVGVYFRSGATSKAKPWHAQISLRMEIIELGDFVDELQAARAYDSYVVEHKLGRRLNFAIASASASSVLAAAAPVISTRSDSAAQRSAASSSHS